MDRAKNRCKTLAVGFLLVMNATVVGLALLTEIPQVVPLVLFLVSFLPYIACIKPGRQGTSVTDS
jgi:hypothetical protein